MKNQSHLAVSILQSKSVIIGHVWHTAI